ncbi:MAG: ABC transporter ATP-binding protein [Lachnospiraceae bacterium]|nr:ABC transporter ATP-binding protein [Lachnospiraceae bacterium]
MEVKNAVKKYGKGDATVYALNSAELEIEKGEVCVILGPSGSGKSTLLNILGGLDHLDDGSVKIDGKEITGLSAKQLTEYRRSDVGFVFQFYNLIPDLTVRENIEVVSDISNKALDATEIMKALGIEEYKYRFPRELSGGQQQRTAIGRALIKNPKILLCDELTGALDSKSSAAVLKYIEKVNKEFKTTIIIITHNEDIRLMADRIIRIKDGKVVLNEKNQNKISAEMIEV